MKHLIISREYPPASYAPGGIGAYVANIARLMAEHGETVHVIAERWAGASKDRETFYNGNLIVHRIGEQDLPPERTGEPGCSEHSARTLEGLRKSAGSAQWFAWHVAFLAEKLICEEGIEVIEAQEWEAPLYVLLTRRALGLGRGNTIPCIVHLHSPSELNRNFNGALKTADTFSALQRRERYCIENADALLCPSRYLADQSEELYSLDAERIKVIPLPAGFTPLIERPRDVWADGSICYVGRLEPRKGIIEWVDAAIRVSHENPAAHFDFVGADIWALKSQLLDRIPKPFLSRFRFHGSKSREELPKFLAKAKAGVVPSRWENFPNVCLEAMSSGLPVIATRNGGMIEMVEDGKTGWLTRDAGVGNMVDGLTEALRRCLATSPETRAEMGRAAGASIRAKCDNTRTVSEHKSFRAEIARAGARRSSCQVRQAPPSSQPLSPNAQDKGSGIVVRVERLGDATRVVKSIAAQTTLPRALVIVTSVPSNGQSVDLPKGLTVQIVNTAVKGPAAWNVGLAAMERGTCATYFFLDEHDEVEPHCIELVETVFARRPDIGVASFWVDVGRRRLDAPPSPDIVTQLLENEVAQASAFRAAAIDTKEPFSAGLPSGYDIWGLANAVLAAGWQAVTIPELLARREAARPVFEWPAATALRSIRSEVISPLLAKLPPAFGLLIERYVPIPQAKSEAETAEDRLNKVARYLAILMLNPSRATQALASRSRAFFNRARLTSLPRNSDDPQ